MNLVELDLAGMERINLFRKKLTIAVDLPDDSVKVDLVSHGNGQFLRSTLWEYHYVHEESYRHPADWWEAFKQRFMPNWLLKKFPVKWRVVSIVSMPNDWRPGLGKGLKFAPKAGWRNFLIIQDSGSEPEEV